MAESSRAAARAARLVPAGSGVSLHARQAKGTATIAETNNARRSLSGQDSKNTTPSSHRSADQKTAAALISVAAGSGCQPPSGRLRVRGTMLRAVAFSHLRRVIPACAGNRFWTAMRSVRVAGHPYVCGEQLAGLRIGVVGCGSSLRVRGTVMPIRHRRLPSNTAPRQRPRPRCTPDLPRSAQHTHADGSRPQTGQTVVHVSGSLPMNPQLVPSSAAILISVRWPP